MYTSEDNQKNDQALQASIQYIEAIKHHLKPRILDNGDAMLYPDEITPSIVKKLESDLTDIIYGNTGESARLATKYYGEKNVQGVAFGELEDFQTTIKIGVLYCKRIVLWDLLSTICHDITYRISKAQFVPLKLNSQDSIEIAKIASNVLSIEKLVRDGALVILGHPSAWSKETMQIVRDSYYGKYGVYFSTKQGLTLATSLSVSNFLHLHPFTLEESASYNPGLPELQKLFKYYSNENKLLQRSYANILATNDFNYIDEISASNFYELVKYYQDVPEELNNLIGEVAGKSEQQLNSRMSYVKKRINTAISTQNSNIYKIKKSLETSGPLVGATMQFMGVQGILSIVGQLMEATGAAINHDTVLNESSIIGFFSDAKYISDNTHINIVTSGY